MGKTHLTTRKDRSRARARREKTAGQLVPVDFPAVEDLLRGAQLSTVSRQTGVPRRTLDHLRSGKVARTRYRVLERLASHYKRDIKALISTPGRPTPPTLPGAYACHSRADMTLRSLGEAGVASPNDEILRSYLERIHDLDTVRRIWGASGLAVWRLEGEAGWRPVRANRRKLERLKAEYADLIHKLFVVVLQASSAEADRGVKPELLLRTLEAVATAADASMRTDEEMANHYAQSSI